MSPYIVTTGVYSAGTRYGPGAVLPDGIGDEAMALAGAIEWHGDALPAQSVEGLAEFLGVAAPDEAAPALSEPDLDAMDFAALREAAKAAGINSFGKSADALRDELKGGA